MFSGRHINVSAGFLFSVCHPSKAAHIMEQPTTASLIQGGAFCEHCGRTFSEVFTQIAEKSVRAEIVLIKHKLLTPDI